MNYCTCIAFPVLLQVKPQRISYKLTADIWSECHRHLLDELPVCWYRSKNLMQKGSTGSIAPLQNNALSYLLWLETLSYKCLKAFYGGIILNIKGWHLLIIWNVQQITWMVKACFRYFLIKDQILWLPKNGKKVTLLACRDKKEDY